MEKSSLMHSGIFDNQDIAAGRTTDTEIILAFEEYVKNTNLPAHIKNGDYRSAWVRQARDSFYAGWRLHEQKEKK